MKILALVDIWEGSNGFAFAKAFARLGHIVRVIAPNTMLPYWRTGGLRAPAVVVRQLGVREVNLSAKAALRTFKPDMLFVYKGRSVRPGLMEEARALRIVSVNIFPDVSAFVHGKLIPKALPRYDWVFTTKRFAINDFKAQLGMDNCSFLAHGYDPDIHRQQHVSSPLAGAYDCEASFIGTWSPKKAAYLQHLLDALPKRNIRVWGEQWNQLPASLSRGIEGRGAVSSEYAVAISHSSINIALLSETRPGSSSGDQTTSRTFHIPATGGFMLHERTDEVLEYFDEGHEIECFGSPEELAFQTDRLLSMPDHCRRLADAARQRSIQQGYSIQDRAHSLLEHLSSLGLVDRRRLT